MEYYYEIYFDFFIKYHNLKGIIESLKLSNEHWDQDSSDYCQQKHNNTAHFLYNQITTFFADLWCPFA